MSAPLCWYGSTAPPLTRRLLRAGPLVAEYEAGDLRYVRWRGVEIVRRWYAAVRDCNWGTVPGVLSDESIEESADGFRIEYLSTHRQGDIAFTWRGTIAGSLDGIEFHFDGRAESTFFRNRIGFCVLHPPETCAGRTVVLNGVESSEFPEAIAPRNPFHELRSLRHPVGAMGDVEFQFEGDLFETEDQRNWIDASYKTFCTPLRLPFPALVPAGEFVRQTVTLRLHPEINSGVTTAATLSAAANDAAALVLASIPPGIVEGHAASAGNVAELRWRDAAEPRSLPPVGVAAPSDGVSLSPREQSLVAHLGPHHWRVESHPAHADFAERMHRAAAEAPAPLELAVILSDNAAAEARRLACVLHELRPRIARILLHHDREWCTPERLAAPFTRELAAAGVAAPVFVGTQANFAELNRGRPPLADSAGVGFSAQPQEHAFDNASLVECCSMIGDAVRCARRLAGGRAVVVTPITLRKRVNPYATGPAPATPPGAAPGVVDVRQMSLFGAAWTLAALKYLAESGAAAATFYEAVGWLGALERDGGCPLPDQFPSAPGTAFPLFHVLADASELVGAQVRPCDSSAPLAVEVLGLRHNGGDVLLAANMTPQPQTLLAPWTGRARLRMLDETSYSDAGADPKAFRVRRVPAFAASGRLAIPLNPFAYVRIDG